MENIAVQQMGMGFGTSFSVMVKNLPKTTGTASKTSCFTSSIISMRYVQMNAQIDGIWFGVPQIRKIII